MMLLLLPLSLLQLLRRAESSQLEGLLMLLLLEPLRPAYRGLMLGLLLLWLLPLLHHAGRGLQEHMLQLLLGCTGRGFLGGVWKLGHLIYSTMGDEKRQGRYLHWWETRQSMDHGTENTITSKKVLQQWPRQLKLTRQ